jgi:hypothetical protein
LAAGEKKNLLTQATAKHTQQMRRIPAGTVFSAKPNMFLSLDFLF